jgi:hypothetical protein
MATLGCEDEAAVRHRNEEAKKKGVKKRTSAKGKTAKKKASK